MARQGDAGRGAHRARAPDERGQGHPVGVPVVGDPGRVLDGEGKPVTGTYELEGTQQRLTTLVKDDTITTKRDADLAAYEDQTSDAPLLEEPPPGAVIILIGTSRGSSGKTSTKDLLAGVVGRLGPTAELLPEVATAVLVFAVGMAIFTAPLS